LLLQSLAALITALRFARFAMRAPSSRTTRQMPKAAVIIPCKGTDSDFEENIGAYLAQDYRHYELIFVTESTADPAYAALTRMLSEYNRPVWVTIAGESNGQGQKVHNLCAAIELLNSVNKRAEVLVFADADARPSENWLRELVATLDDEHVGAATGFRWYSPACKGVWPRLLSAWNASALNLLGERSSFAWGGAMAIRRDYFQRLKIKEQWEGAVSDDYALTQAVQASGLRIKFVPSGLMLSEAKAGFKELLEFTTRQITITRVYAPRVWMMTACAHVLYNITFWGGLLCLAANILMGRSINLTLLILLIGSFWMGALTGGARAFVAASILPDEYRVQVRKHWWAYLISGPIVSLLFLYNIIASAFTRNITWHGIGYEMVSPHETIVSYRPEPSTLLKHPSEISRQASGAKAESSSTQSN
ncbi:MAG TPA: glycosyltransferase, partial [Blastocatellia bacterium]|nr:glycosyltransferase [Blastocatellia bacterium]